MNFPLHPLRFPRRFAWGVATSATQIEGAASADGKGESIWDRLARTPGKIDGGDTPEVACDHYHRYREDVRLMQWLGVKHYRFSVAWPRIFPNGDGTLNRKGLDFYRRLVDTLATRGITPWVTLFHWDLPQALEERGGWRSRATVDAFARYADTVVGALSGTVKHWITLNEIFCFTADAYGGGRKAPAVNEGEAVVNQAYHHALLAHGHAVRAVREFGGRGARVGLTDAVATTIPVTETPADIAAARTQFVADNWRVVDAIYRGRYATAYLKSAGAARPKVQRDDFKLISLPTDYLGVNLYWGSFVRAGKRGRPERVPFPPHYPRCDADWLKHTPQAMYWGPRHVAEIYGVKSIVITENGAAYEDDVVSPTGEIHDLHRRDYLRNYLRELHRAIGDGVPVQGYFVWSLLDNFEWHDGYAKRLGLFHTDFKTQRRTAKLSAHWYRTVVRENRLV